MSELIPWILGAAVLVIAGGVLWVTYREGRPDHRTHDYHHALELWIEGELEEATTLLRKIVHEDPQKVEPFQYLGDLLRIQGEPGTAAVLHRGLTVSPNLPVEKRIVVGLSLAEDLLALKQWDEAGEVLDSLRSRAHGRRRFWKAAFVRWHGAGNMPEAARSLKKAPKHCQERDRVWFQQAYACYQLDRALTHALANEAGEARARLRDVRGIEGTRARAALVEAVLAAKQEDPAAALTVASDHLLDNPLEMEIFLPLLQQVLLQSGQFARTIPVLERACQAEQAPPSLWISLALLYEKLDQRDKAMRLLESKARSHRFTPDNAAPYLRILAEENASDPFSRVWKMLSMPTAVIAWTCHACEHTEPRIHWFCPSCMGFDTFGPGGPRERVT